MGIILSGVQPTGNLTLGNYLGAIRNWVTMQSHNTCFFCIVDLHALTVPQDPKKLKMQTREVAAAYIASGINPSLSTIFIQSNISAHTELSWFLSCFTPMGWLNRMIQFKEKSGKNRESSVLGLYAYPVLQAADILLYKATDVPVGEDQKQHVELARDIAGAFNRAYEKEIFPLPEPQILGEATRVMSLRDGTKKMSKSDPSEFSRIHLRDDADTIAQKIKKAKTDPDPLPEDPKLLTERPEAFNLVNIYSALSNQSLESVCHQFAGAQFSTFKPALADLVVSIIAPIGLEIERLMNHEDELDGILKKGNDHAREVAEKTLHEVQKTIGILRV
ncbi:tryptophan--tRNA ligase [Candidatus Nucleicultrix amoebiphila]|jgi:tryptophanyl-tRNA synthetase|uniref:Tryptophan--tRNA ligase n=1 Tax=Candidatus Nucleicultrix amoebiphila FS5 TaxID=1414854 RepID=A0A1W6N5Q7_9PROT|nr:tryptophan--tRNA ligase [Candidatus Nucleicultrix amoebiphila]ARN85203.1 tryptophanyl-tRNA synthetase [Candidatus Nucleicultrix amoebiphila FS5]